ncbi:MAG: pro-sigmaK processing inhibitor BofA [Firmicutes bacterium]|nr:pro-sigmaK processing inhibitor BofA [Bacillota bacterium]
MLNIDVNFVLAFFFGVLVLYILARVLYFPLRLFLRFLINALAGGLLLALFNVFGTFWGVQIGLNAVTAVVVGVMGVPGVILLLILQHLTA